MVCVFFLENVIRFLSHFTTLLDKNTKQCMCEKPENVLVYMKKSFDMSNWTLDIKITAISPSHRVSGREEGEEEEKRVVPSLDRSCNWYTHVLSYSSYRLKWPR